MTIRRAGLALALIAGLTHAALAAVGARGATRVLPSGPVPEAALAMAVAPQPGPDWTRTATPDVALHVDTEPDRERPCVLIAFTPRDPQAGHCVERAECPTGPWQEISSLTRGQIETTDRRLVRHRRYYYRMVAVFGMLRSFPSPVVEVDLPAISRALENKSTPGSPRQPPVRRAPDVYDSDGTAMLLCFLLVRSFVRRRHSV